MLGFVLFPDHLETRLSLIALAITAMGTVTIANCWTVLFKGNINLSQVNGLFSNILSCGKFSMA